MNTVNLNSKEYSQTNKCKYEFFNKKIINQKIKVLLDQLHQFDKKRNLFIQSNKYLHSVGNKEGKNYKFLMPKFLKYLYQKFLALFRTITSFLFSSSRTQASAQALHEEVNKPTRLESPNPESPRDEAASQYEILLKKHKDIQHLLEDRSTTLKRLQQQLTLLIARGKQRQARNKQAEIVARKQQIESLANREKIVRDYLERLKTPSTIQRERKEYQKLEREVMAAGMRNTVSQNPTLNMFGLKEKLRRINSETDEVSAFLNH